MIIIGIDDQGLNICLVPTYLLSGNLVKIEMITNENDVDIFEAKYNFN